MAVRYRSREKNSCLSFSENKQQVQIKLMMTALGDISGWSINDLNRYSSLLNRLSSRSLAMIDGQVLIGSLILLSQVKAETDEIVTFIDRFFFENNNLG